MIEVWYVMEDGTVGDPRAVSPDAAGVLRHTDGRAVAMRADGETPRSRGVTADERAALAKAMKPAAPKRGYVTRESKAR